MEPEQQTSLDMKYRQALDNGAPQDEALRAALNVRATGLSLMFDQAPGSRLHQAFVSALDEGYRLGAQQPEKQPAPPDNQ